MAQVIVREKRKFGKRSEEIQEIVRKRRRYE